MGHGVNLQLRIQLMVIYIVAIRMVTTNTATKRINVDIVFKFDWFTLVKEYIASGLIVDFTY